VDMSVYYEKFGGVIDVSATENADANFARNAINADTELNFHRPINRAHACNYSVRIFKINYGC
jgi:hypothetical protein